MVGTAGFPAFVQLSSVARLVKGMSQYVRIAMHHAKHTSTLRNVLAALLVTATTAACGAEAPNDSALAQDDQALTQLTGLVNARTGGYVSTLKLARDASVGCGAQSVQFSGAGKTVQARTCVGKYCESTPLSSLTFVDDDGPVAPSDLTLATIDEHTGDVDPVVVDDLLYVCKENEKEGVCECIPSFPK